MPSTNGLPVNCINDGGCGMTYIALAGFRTALYCRPSIVLMDRTTSVWEPSNPSTATV
ncbi:MAG: hypothetical protein GY774_26170 [Planctomycetes bacterium]|nr:hypothetical protein [Planctomycetota bacterium]